LVVEAATALGVAAPCAPPHAAVAVMLVTPVAQRDALVAEHFVAAGAAVNALVADRSAALLTDQPSAEVHAHPTLTARDAIPIVQRDEWAVRVVASQQIGDDHEEVEQATFLQRTPDRQPAVSFADRFILDMRVRDAIVGRRRMRIEGDHAVLITMVEAERLPVEADLERSQVNAVEDDRLGDHGEGLGPAIELQFVELLLQCEQIQEDVADRDLVC